MSTGMEREDPRERRSPEEREEALMAETFGDEYRRYMARTSRILPGIY